MISFAFRCDQGHGSSGWFRSNDDFDRQVETSLVECPICGSTRISKALMAPAISRARQPLDRRPVDVGDRFAAEARRIHSEGGSEVVMGRATNEDARRLLEDGIPIARIVRRDDSKRH